MLADHFRRQGLTVISSPPSVNDNWISKPFFRRRSRELFPDMASVPLGYEFDAATPDQVVDAVRQLFALGFQRVIIKMNGAGGFANKIVLKRDGHDLSKLVTEYFRKPLDPKSNPSKAR